MLLAGRERTESFQNLHQLWTLARALHQVIKLVYYNGLWIDLIRQELLLPVQDIIHDNRRREDDVRELPRSVVHHVGEADIEHLVFCDFLLAFLRIWGQELDDWGLHLER